MITVDTGGIRMNIDTTNLFQDSEKKKQRFLDFSTKPAEQHSYRLRQFQIASTYLEEYTEAIALFGTRRLGKTVTLNQLWDKYHTNKSVYLKIYENALIDEVMSYVISKDEIDYLFVDEITNILSLDIVAAELLDYCKAYNIKVVVTGTNSFLLSVALTQSACGRFNVVSFNPPNYLDLTKVRKTTLNEFIMGENTFYVGRNYLRDISYDILKAIDYLGNYKIEPLEPLDLTELQRNIEIITELLILSKTAKLPRNGLIFARKYYKNLDMNEVIYKTNSKKEIVYYVYNILLDLQLLIQLPVQSFGERTQIYKLYLTTPVMYAGLLANYQKEALPTKLGFLFECVVVSQLYQIFQINTKFRLYTFRDEEERIEYDLVIEDNITNTLYLNEIKYSDSKYGKYKKNELVEKYYKGYSVKYVDITPSNLTETLTFYQSVVI